jgi:hypothetical protein
MIHNEIRNKWESPSISTSINHWNSTTFSFCLLMDFQHC